MPERDWEKDWKLHQEVVRGPWRIEQSNDGRCYVASSTGFWIDVGYSPRTARFIAEAREALPYWLQRVKELEDALRQCVEALELSSHKELCKMTVGPYDLIDYAKRVLEGERNDVDGLGLESLVESGANQSLGKGGQSRMPSAHPAGEGMGRDDGAEMGRRAWHTE